MVRAIECIYEDNVLKPVGKIQLKEGERIRVTIEKKLTSSLSVSRRKFHRIASVTLKDESWTSS